MRCTKCGYTSFDYLGECSKCGTSLDGIRDGLGFSAARPAVPFLLRSLIKNGADSVEQDSTPEKEPGSSSFEFEEEFGGGFQIVHENEAQSEPEAIPNPDEGEEDFSLLDLSDEELELLIDKKPDQASGKQPDLWLEPEAAGDVTTPAPAPARDFAFGQAGNEGQVKESAFDLDFDLNMPPATAAKSPDSGIELGMPAAPASEAPQAEVAGQKQQEIEDDFLVELSEDDLETLLMDLDGKKPEGEKPKEAPPTGPKGE